MKGQSLVVQFLLFFLIGLGLFTAIGGIFRLQSDIVRGDTAEINRKLIGSYVSSLAISMSSSCKECDFINQTIKLKNVTANYIVNLSITRDGLQISSEPGGGKSFASIHKLGQTYDMKGNASSPLTVLLELNNTRGTLNMTNKP